jgi:hypothetical protein
MAAILESVPPRVRAWVYAILATAGLVLGSLQVAYLTLGVQPLWLTVSLAVFAFLVGPGNTMAASNTPVPRRELREE